MVRAYVSVLRRACLDVDCPAYLDEISALQDVEFLYDRLKALVASHINPLNLKELKGGDKMRNHVVSTVSSQYVSLIIPLSFPFQQRHNSVLLGMPSPHEYSGPKILCRVTVANYVRVPTVSITCT